MDGLGGKEQHLAWSDDNLPVPHPLRDEAGLTLTETNRLFLGTLEIRSEEYEYFSFKEVQQFILFRMDLPLVAHSGCLHGKDAHVTTIELHREILDRGHRAPSSIGPRFAHSRDCIARLYLTSLLCSPPTALHRMCDGA